MSHGIVEASYDTTKSAMKQNMKEGQMFPIVAPINNL